jgi:MFS transporter, MHS family, proline/betaine transporter
MAEIADHVGVAQQGAADRINRKAIVAACIGSALEWYDVFIYLYFSLTIAKLFFPVDDPTVSLLLAVGAFGLSYLAKPFGALFFGSYADRVSRKQALTLTLSLMALGIALITFAPSYSAIGVPATIIVLLGRLIQGFSSGGEYSAATAFLVERAPDNLRGYYSSFNISAIGLTSVIGGLVGLSVNNLLTSAQVAEWGWRLPFALGLLIIPASIYLRRSIPEVPGHAPRREARPLTEVVARHKMLCVLCFGGFAVITITNYSLAFYLPTYAMKDLGLTANVAFLATMVYGGLQCVLSPVFGYLSDRWGRPQLLTASSLGLAVASVPCFLLLVKDPSLGTLLASEVILGLFATAYQASMPAYLCDLFPKEVRTTGVAVVHDLTATALGGFTPFFITLMIRETGSKLVPGVYVFAAALLAYVAVRALKRRFNSQGPGLEALSFPRRNPS